jgi:signal transduction histidine kinase
VNRLLHLARSHGADALIVAVAAEGALEVLLRDSPDAPTTPAWIAAPALALVVLVLLGRRRMPFAAPAAVWALAAALSFVDGRLIPFTASVFVAGFAASFLLGNLRDASQARLGLAVVLLGAVIVVFNDPTHSGGELIFTPLLFAIGWVAGFALRGRSEQAEAAEARAAQAERERETAARLAAAEERARIARELHDIVAHSVSVMVLQVGAVRHRLAGDRPDDGEALEGVERTGRNALAEMRRLLGAMRREGDDLELTPQPGLSNLGVLADEVSRAGLPVSLHVADAPRPLPHALDVSAYRIVQEGLTNALKHSDATRVDVTISYDANELGIEVRDNGAGVVAGDGQGHGFVGIRERLKVYGGAMTAGQATDGGFVLDTRLPLDGGEP